MSSQFFLKKRNYAKTTVVLSRPNNVHACALVALAKTSVVAAGIPNLEALDLFLSFQNAKQD
jgi:hypothetical protein